MKQKRIFIIVIMFLVVCLLAIFTTETNATEIEMTGRMGIKECRENGYGYRVGSTDSSENGRNNTVWKIVRYPNYISDEEPGSEDEGKPLIYCLRAGVGFTSTSSTEKYPNYQVNYDMNTKKGDILDNIMTPLLQNDGLTSELIDTYKGNYNKILWILDNIYIPGKSSEDDKENLLLKAIPDIGSNNYSGQRASLSDDDIEVVQQLAIWYYTNFDQNVYNGSNFTTIYIGQNDNYQALADLEVAGEVRQNAMEKLFTYFISNAEINNADGIDYYENRKLIPLSINKNNATVVEDNNNNFKFGPYSITKNTNLSYDLTLTFTGPAYTLIDENGNTITNINEAIENLEVGETINIYALIPSNVQYQSQKLKFEYRINYQKTNAIFITTDATTYQENQPLVYVEKEPSIDEGNIEINIPQKNYDFALRKFITAINGNTVENTRMPIVDPTVINTEVEGQTITTANYKHRKDPLSVKKGDIVTYTIRVYNEGELDGYVSEITDKLPGWLEFCPELNTDYAWSIGSDNKTITTDITSKNTESTGIQSNLYGNRGEKGTKLSAYHVGETLDYIDVQIKCKVRDNIDIPKGTIITNIAYISGMTDENGQNVNPDRDSGTDTERTPNPIDLENYTGKNQYSVEALANSNEYYEGEEDDDDFEKLILNPPEIDLKLIKSIVKVNEVDQEERLTDINVENLNKIINGELVTTATYKMDKDPVLVKKGDEVTYRLRIYNEGLVDGYAKEISENIPEGLKFLPEDEINIQYGWSVSQSDNRKITTDYLSKEKETTDGQNLLTAFGENDGTKTKENLAYKDVYVKMEVTSEDVLEKIIRNEAAITDDSDTDGKEIDDRDSKPEEWKKENSSEYYDDDNTWPTYKEDDEDYDNIVLKPFDLSLRKFITKVNSEELTGNNSREPVVDTSKLNKIVNGVKITTADYNHTKEPIKVKQNDKVVYTLRVYNEGYVDGYAAEIQDHLPEYLEFDSGIVDGVDYGWTVSEDGRTVTTTYLSKENEETSENIIKAAEKQTNPTRVEDTYRLDYKDIKILCKVKSNATVDQKITNIAEITKYQDENGDDIKDRDSNNNGEETLPYLPTGENLANYKDNETGDYIPGQEDDDDFEKLIIKPFDLSLRKFITKVNSEELTDNNSREPDVDTSKLNKIVNGVKITTADYNHTKEPVIVKKGDEVVYTLRVYNEGEIDGYAAEIQDHLPEYLEFIPEDELNVQYGWTVSEDGRTVTTDYLKKPQLGSNEKILQAARKQTNPTRVEDTYQLYSRDVQIKCRVKSNATVDQKITNIAEITKYQDENGDDIKDRDSNNGEETLPYLPTDEELPNYKDNETGTYIPGQEDDDDFEKLIIKPFDLALRKFITGVNNTAITNREPVPTYDEVAGKIVYNHTKDPVEVEKGNIVEYTIRVYNEGKVAGYAELVKDDIPEGLEFLPNNETNRTYEWKMYKVVETNGQKEYVEVTNAEDAEVIITDYLSEEKETENRQNKLEAFDKDNNTISYKDVKVAFKVIEPSTSQRIITNRAEIQEDSDDDIDSTPGEWNDGEDDQDIENIKVKPFDLALRKFITGVNDTAVNNRYPEVSYDKVAGKIVYTHTKDALDVRTNNIITYTIRVYNEGKVEGYAEQVKDNIPEGLEFLPDNDTNKEYEWKMYKVVETNGQKEYVEVTNAQDAEVIITDYLSEEKETENRQNKINPFDESKEISKTNPDYKDVKVAFKVVEPETSDRVIINKAEIQKDSGDDIDSTPGEWNDGEDDQDIEKIKVKYFDLALKKWVSQAIVTDNGDTNIIESGHTGDENPEPIVKVEIYHKKIDKVTVKFRYQIKVINEGTIAGYAYELKDHIPEGLKFVAEDNPLWTDLGNGVISTTQLQNTLLQPGETATVDVLLTWINGQDNMGLKVNIAEISKDSDDDIDSTPDNNVPEEDDQDDAPVMLSVRTGQMRVYFLLTGVILATLSGGIILIKKFVL